MAPNDRPAVPLEEEHEYALHCSAIYGKHHTLTRAPAMKRCRPTSPSLRICSRAHSRASLYVLQAGVVMYPPPADWTTGTLSDVSSGFAQGARLRLKRLTVSGRCADCRQTRMQIVNPSPSAMYSGISNAMVTISRAEGFWSLWRGLSSVVMGAGGHRSAQNHGWTQLTVVQVPPTPFTLHRMRPRSMPSAETRERATSTIPLQQVRNTAPPVQRLQLALANCPQLLAVPQPPFPATH